MKPAVPGLIVFLLLGPVAALAQWQIIDLGTPDEEWQWESIAYALNESGQVVGAGAEPSPSTPFPPNAFLWQSGSGMTNLGETGGYAESDAADINEAGRVVGWGDGAVFLWDSASGFTELDLGPGYVTASAINDLDQVVGSAGSRAYIWDSAMGMVDLSTLGGSSSLAHGINNAGQVAGAARLSGDPSLLHAFVLSPQDGLWHRDDDGDGANDLMVDLGGLPGLDYSQAYDINAFGHAVGRAYDYYVDQSRAFLYRDGGMLDLGTLGGEKAYANGINDADQVVGKALTAGGEWHPFLWENGMMCDLSDLMPPGCGWEPQDARDINNAGWITGCGTAPCGERHAFLLIPPYTAPGDLDADGDVDLGDFATFALCYHGANVTLPPTGCEPADFCRADLDHDGDVELNDFATFALNFTG